MNPKTVITALVILAAVVGVAFYVTTPGAPQEQVPNDNTPISDSTVSVSNDYAKEAAVQAAYRAEIAKYPEDHTKMLRTAVVGDYALQEYTGDVMGGEALFKYDPMKQKWVLLDGGGGIWPLDTLVNLMGVPEETAKALLAKFGR